MKVMGQDLPGAFRVSEKTVEERPRLADFAEAVAKVAAQAARANEEGPGPVDDSAQQAHRRAPLRNFLGASSDLAVSLFKNVASVFVGGRKADGVVSPDLTPAQAGAHLKASELAINVYNNSGAPEGFTRVDAAGLQKLGLDAADFDHQRSGLYAAVYRNDESGKYSLAFRGSESGSLHDIKTDWAKSNAGQALGGLPASYRQGAELAAKLTAALGEGVHVVGHSLGGGIANYAAVKNNLDFTVFNAAGLSKPVIKGLSEELSNYKGQGVVINDKYDPLTNLGGQDIDETLGGKHAGYDTLIFVNNDKFDRPGSLLNPRLRVDAHSIDGSISGYLQNESLDAVRR